MDFDQLDLNLSEEAEALNDAVLYAKRKPRTYRGRIVCFFIERRGQWFNRVQLQKSFTDGPFFAGTNWDRRLREVLASKWIEGELDPGKSNGTFRYRMPK